MSDTSGHLSRPMREFIRRLGYSTSKQEELELIREQVNSFRDDLRNIKEENVLKDLFSRYFSNEIGSAGIYEHLLRLLYAHMLGLDVALGCIFAINATQDKSIRLKKLAYMVATRLVVDRPELRILLVASFQRDLICKSIHDLVIVLGAIEKVLDGVILDACLSHILPLLSNENDLVRKKAYLIIYRTRRIVPDRIEDYSRHILAALDDPEFSVKTIGTIMLEYELRTGKMLEESAEKVCKLADQLMVRNAYSKYSYHKMPNPWVQLRLLRCVAMLGSVGNPADLFEVVVLSGKKADRYAAGAM